MWQYNYTYPNELYHHGILGQEWYKRNGPPYPLRASNHSASEKKAGWRKSLDKSDEKGYNKSSKSSDTPTTKPAKKGLTSNQKKAIAIGAAATVTALAVYSAYKTGHLQGVISRGKQSAEAALSSTGNNQFYAGSLGGNKSSNNSKKIVDSVLSAEKVGITKLSKPESLAETLRNVNPSRFDPAYKNNCTFASVTGFLRLKGYDVIAGDTGGKTKDGRKLIESCFKNSTIFDGLTGDFSKSRITAENTLLRNFGENATGVCGLNLKNIDGTIASHMFNWEIKNGKVSFMDFQNNFDDGMMSMLWEHNLINPNGYMMAARLDNAEVNWDEISKQRVSFGSTRIY